MTFVNKLLRIIPKKRINIEELERKSVQLKVAPAQTIRRDELKTESHSSKEPKDAIEEEFEIIEREIMPEKIICPDCGGITLEGLEYCDKCGGDLTNY